jgi:hypothetical protein
MTSEDSSDANGDQQRPVMAAIDATVASLATIPSLSGYRKRALDHYRRAVGNQTLNVCVMCGFGIEEILEVAHLDQDRKNNRIDNLAILCPNCHKMHDIGLIPRDIVEKMRDAKLQVNWKLRIKDAGEKAARTRKANALKASKSESGKLAWATRLAKKALPPEEIS